MFSHGMDSSVILDYSQDDHDGLDSCLNPVLNPNISPKTHHFLGARIVTRGLEFDPLGEDPSPTGVSLSFRWHLTVTRIQEPFFSAHNCRRIRIMRMFEGTTHNSTIKVSKKHLILLKRRRGVGRSRRKQRFHTHKNGWMAK